MDFLNSKKGLALVGVLVGLGMALLAFSGNPANMAMCAACFIRDMAGSMKLQTTETVQYFRPEIVGLVVGSFLIALATREYRSTAGSSPMTRFVLGFIMMIGALIFLGCPLRMVLRMAAGDLNAWVGLIGFVLGVATGTFFLKKGYSLGREHDTNKTAGAVLPVLLIIGLCISVFAGVFAPEKVLVNGKEVAYSRFADHDYETCGKTAVWGYNGADLSAIVYLPETSAAEEITVECRFNEYATSHRELLNGKKALMHRMMALTPEAKLAFGKTVDPYMMLPDSFLALAQCASFINEDPQNTGKYLENIDKAALVKELDSFEKLPAEFTAKVKAQINAE